MRKWGKRPILIALEWLFIIVVASLSIGCRAGLGVYSSAGVPEAGRIMLLEGGQKAGFWETRDLTIYYNFTRTANRLKISGDIQFASYLRNGFQNIMYFNCRALLLDAQGKIIQSIPLATTNYYARAEAVVDFSRVVSLPPGVDAMVFSYTGRARTIGDNEGDSTTDFYYSP